MIIYSIIKKHISDSD